MANLFDKEMNALKREINSLKIAREKSSTMLKTYQFEVELSFDLELTSVQGVSVVRSDKAAVIDFSTGSNNPLIGITYDISGLDDRTIRDIPYYNSESGNIARMIFLYSENQSDYNTLSGGGSVSVSYTLTITATSELSASVSYNDLWVN